MGRVRLAILRALVILVPSYTMAYLTGEMVWTIPTMVGAGILAAAFSDPKRVTDEGDDGDDGDDHEGTDDA